MKIVQKQIGRQDRLPAVPSFWKFFHNLNVLELYFAPTCRRRLALGSHPLNDSNGSPDLLLSTLLTMWKEEGIRRRLWENVCRKANWQ